MASKRYEKSPKIMPKGKGGDKEKEGAPKEAAAKAEKTAGSAKPEVDAGGGAAPKGTEIAGTESVPSSSERHGREMKEMHGRHQEELASMYDRHGKEHKQLATRHAKENEGKSGTEPA